MKNICLTGLIDNATQKSRRDEMIIDVKVASREPRRGEMNNLAVKYHPFGVYGDGCINLCYNYFSPSDLKTRLLQIYNP